MRIFEYQQEVDGSGYEVVEGADIKRLPTAVGPIDTCLAPRSTWTWDDAGRTYRPSTAQRFFDPASIAGLHLRFVRTEPTPEAFTAFADEYGLLLRPEDREPGIWRPGFNGFRHYESLSAWIGARWELGRAVRALQASSALDGRAEERVSWKRLGVVYEDEHLGFMYTFTPNHWQYHELDRSLPGESARRAARFVFQIMCNEVLRKHTSAQLLAVPGVNDVPMRVFIHPKSLLGAMWAQMIKGIDDRKHLGVCRECGEVFESERSSARYCPESMGTWCRQNHSRKQARGRRTHNVPTRA